MILILFFIKINLNFSILKIFKRIITKIDFKEIDNFINLNLFNGAIELTLKTNEDYLEVKKILEDINNSKFV